VSFCHAVCNVAGFSLKLGVRKWHGVSELFSCKMSAILTRKCEKTVFGNNIKVCLFWFCYQTAD
jgi:hypothetical protein